MADREMLSVGIDVGTTTTQVVLSRLVVRNKRRLGLVPRLDVDSSAEIYSSPVHETPLLAPDEIDVDALSALVRREYDLAGVAPGQVETGAVIITGETARSRNADAVLHGIAGLAGDFVVTVAGPNLEAQIAGRGSGAADWSARHFASVVNVDIGGGSANAAHFRSGAHVASSASMVGGRQARLDPRTGVLVHLAPSGRILSDALGLRLSVGAAPTLEALRALADAMADICVDLVLGTTSPLADKVALTPPMPAPENVTAYFVSGGVGRCYYGEEPTSTLQQVAAYGDVGPLFAAALRANRRWSALPVREPRATLRATVLGAASQQVTLSGSTIWAEADVLPLKNLPVIAPDMDADLRDPDRLAADLGSALARWDRSDAESGGVAISLSLPPRLDFARLQVLAAGIAAFATSGHREDTPLVLVTVDDYAQVIGQTLKSRLPRMPLVVIDQIGLSEGDFIDIGLPMLDGRVVPVSVKTLVFYH